jgi:hypothetical protein
MFFQIKIIKYTNKHQLFARRAHHINIRQPASYIKHSPFIEKLHQLRESTAHIPADELSPHIKQAISVLENSTSKPAPKNNH